MSKFTSETARRARSAVEAKTGPKPKLAPFAGANEAKRNHNNPDLINVKPVTFALSAEEMHACWQSLMLNVQWFDNEAEKGNPPPGNIRNEYMMLANRFADLLHVMQLRADA